MNRIFAPRSPTLILKRTRARKRAPVARAAARTFPVVGVGASAGGLEAFTQLLKSLPRDTGMAFVLVQHLDPGHESSLPQLLAKTTLMQVREVTDGLAVGPNQVYVIPPNTCMAIKQGKLELQPRLKATGPHLSIDLFFESLAQDQGERAIGVILSGTATDGTQGLEAIKAESGITFAQDESAKFDSMPRSAIAAGCVDFVLSPKNIARELTRIAQHPYVAGQARPPAFASRLGNVNEPQDDAAGDEPVVPSRKSGQPRVKAEAETGRGTPETLGFKKVLLHLRNHSGVDFSLHKPNTILRRIARRMVLNQKNTMGAYAEFLRSNAKELSALYSDVLINVTSFFRNPEAFETLKRKVFARLNPQRHGEPVRVWVLGCSTGQEAYSLVMAFIEYFESINNAPKLQVFGTDLNAAVLDKARAGLYPAALMQQVSAERQRRFFTQEQGGYRVNKSLREMCVFARQNILGDPPFSRMDLISCRNLLIYIEPDAQKKILPMFHYALKPGGLLFLGASESVGSFSNLFECADKQSKIFTKKAVATPSFHLSTSRGRTPAGKENTPGIKGNAADKFPSELNAQREADRVTAKQFAPPGVVINDELQILQFRGLTRPYLEPSEGKASFDVLKMAREGLRLPLRAAINEARKENRKVRKENVRIGENNGGARTVNVEIIPLKGLKERHYLILFETAGARSRQEQSSQRREAEAPPVAHPSARGNGEAARLSAAVRRVAELELDLAEARDSFQSIEEQHEAAGEELQTANEEAQSANEELQSINEELETSKEELESTNEELTTVNEEMANRNGELNRLNNDLSNLHLSINTAILVLGRDLTIRQFTPLAEKAFNLRAADIGRPLSDIKHNLAFPGLGSFLTEVIDTVSVRERETQDRDGHWFLLRARPYLTQDSKIDGAVVMLVDINALKKSEEQIKETRDYAAAIVESVPPLLVLDQNLRVLTANTSFYKHFQVLPEQTENRLIYDLGNSQWNIPQLRTFLEDVLPQNRFFADFEVIHEFENIGRRTMLVSGRQVDHLQKILLSIDDITERVKSQAALGVSERRFRRLFEAAKDGILVVDPVTRKITDANPFITELLGYKLEELVGRELWEIGLLKDEAASQAAFRELQAKGYIRYDTLPLESHAGRKREVEFVSNLYEENGHKVIQCNVRDITERKQIEQALKAANNQISHHASHLEETVVERTGQLQDTIGELEAFSYSISHDMRAPLRAMQGFANILLKEHSEQLNREGVNFLQKINAAAGRMDALIQDVLTYTRILRGELTMEVIDLDPLIRQIVETYPQLHAGNADLQIEGVLPKVLGNMASLTQCISNLLINAVKFVKPQARPQVRVWAETVDADVRVWVEDNGIGISSENQERVFKMFERVHHSRDYEGTGIGLAIVRKAVDRMGGKVGVESAVGKGSKFWIQLRREGLGE